MAKEKIEETNDELHELTDEEFINSSKTPTTEGGDDTNILPHQEMILEI